MYTGLCKRTILLVVVFFDYRCVGIFLDSVHLRTSRYGKGKAASGNLGPSGAGLQRWRVGLERNDKAVQ